MRKTILILSLLMAVMTVMAVPAKRGIWKTLKLTDGTEVRAQLMGDEHVHFYVSDDGTKYMASGDDVFAPVDDARIARIAMERRAPMRSAKRRMKSPLKAEMGERTHYLGQKKGLVILVEFTDIQFMASNNLEKYKKVLNQENYSEGSFKGSVSDYFKAQSAGQFELDFDVVGPYTLSHNCKYYGENNSQGDDKRPDEMIVEACQQADAEVDFADYDWDGDGEVDQVFVVYAGKGEADGGAASTIWPHMYYLSATDKAMELDNVTIDTYACSCELSGNSIAGIGTFCHEFSHCMGFPDFYDTSYSGWFGMGSFDLMCGGSYNGNSFLPAGYTAHEKMMCGWQEPTVLADKDTLVEGMLPMSSHGETFIIYNESHPDEYYMLENRQKSGFDASYPARGMLITHVDFNKEIWEWNIPNVEITANSAEHSYYGYPVNDHQRMTVVHADNDDDAAYFNSSWGGYWKTTEDKDLYPYGSRDSLTATSAPAISYYNNGGRGFGNANKAAMWAILNIKQNSDGTMSFRYRAPSSGDEPGPGGEDDPDKPVDDALFYESFDKCNGTGGNDGLWNGSIANAPFVPDNEGWWANEDKALGANKCAKFGTGKVDSYVSTPSFAVEDRSMLTFKAASWNQAADGTTLLVEAENATMEPNEFELKKGEWTEYTATIKGTGNVKLIFSVTKRFFLDEVKVVNSSTTAIKSVNAGMQQGRIYTLDGRYVGTSKIALRHGIYVMNGKKFVK